MGVVTALVFMGLGGGTPVGGVTTDTVAADALVGGGNEGAAEAVADILDFTLSGRSFPVTGRMISNGFNVSVCSSAQLDTAAASDCRLARCCEALSRSFSRLAGPFFRRFLGGLW